MHSILRIHSSVLRLIIHRPSHSCCWAAVEGDPYCFFKDGSGDDNTAGDDGGDATNCFILAANASEPFSEEEVETMRGFFLANVNIEGKGTVVAGYNDASAVGGSYYYQ